MYIEVTHWVEHVGIINTCILK